MDGSACTSRGNCERMCNCISGRSGLPHALSPLGTQVRSSNGCTALLCHTVQPIRRYHSTSSEVGGVLGYGVHAQRLPAPKVEVGPSLSTFQCPPALAKSFPSPARLGRFLFFTHSGSARDARDARTPGMPGWQGPFRSCSSDPSSSLPRPADCRLQTAEVQKCSSAEVQTDQTNPSHPPQRSALTPPANGRPAPQKL